MADLVLGVLAKFRETLAEPGRDEYRVISEPTAARGFESDRALARAIEGVSLVPIIAIRDKRQHATETSGSLLSRHIAQQAQKFGGVGGVGRIARIRYSRGEPCRVNTGRAVKRVDLQAGIVRQHQHVG